jgi:hypothetical protein
MTTSIEKLEALMRTANKAIDFYRRKYGFRDDTEELLEEAELFGTKKDCARITIELQKAAKDLLFAEERMTTAIEDLAVLKKKVGGVSKKKRQLKLYHGTSDRNGIIKPGNRILPGTTQNIKGHFDGFRTAKENDFYINAYATTDIKYASYYAVHAAYNSFSHKKDAQPIIYEVFWPRCVETDWRSEPLGIALQSKTGFRVKHQVPLVKSLMTTIEMALARESRP